MGIKIKLDLESAFLVFFFALLLWTASASVYDYRLVHEKPTGYFASDAYQNYGISAGISEQGDFRYQPKAPAGGYTDVVGHYPPILYLLPVLFSSISGLPIYDSIFLIVLLFFSLAPLGIYYIIRKTNKTVAMLSLPFTLLIFTGKFYSAFTWGQWGFLTGSFFSIFAIWAATRFELRKGVTLFALFLTATVYGHATGFIFAVMFTAFYAALILLYNKFNPGIIRQTIKGLAIAGLIFVFLSAYYIIIFQNTWGKSQPFSFEVTTVKDLLEGRPFPAVVEGDFGLLLIILLVAGLAMGILTLFKRLDTGIAAGLFLSAIGYTNYVGFGGRAFQARFLWPLYLSVFFGLAIYYASGLVVKNWKLAYSVGTALAASGLLLAVFYTPGTGAMVDQDHWNGFVWIRDNAEKDAKVLFLYQDFMSQTAVYYSTQRETYIINIDDYVAAISSRNVRRDYVIDRIAEHSSGLPYRQGLFSYRYHSKEEDIRQQRDICSFDYYVIDRLSAQPAMAQYNGILANDFIGSGMAVVHTNPVLVILKNNNPGGECVNERSI